MKYIYFFSIVTIIFIFYVEHTVGNIIWRINVNGIRKFQPGNIIHYLFNPLYNTFLWNIELLDVNYIFVILISSFFYYKFDIYSYNLI